MRITRYFVTITNVSMSAVRPRWKSGEIINYNDHNNTLYEYDPGVYVIYNASVVVDSPDELRK